MAFGKFLLSPTRTFLPVIKRVLDRHREDINGIIHCTGGGQTKVGKFLTGSRAIKNDLLPYPPLFEMIKRDTNTSWKEMYQVFNMGHRLEFYCDNNTAKAIIDISRGFNIEAQVVGYVEKAEHAEVVIESAHGTFVYEN